ncbi:Lipid tranfer protein [Zostera marina]|uniref:Lipid tranfer protein n=1 Tax=Zostera marina TaxID=29655 RepID=A0A0K9PD79_ZOSMR|nr:Lipid tranfer protein [Zostera marina]
MLERRVLRNHPRRRMQRSGETGIGKCFGYIMGKENPAPRECCSQVAGVMSTKIACLCLSIKGAFEDDQTGGVSFYNALQIGNSCKIDGLDPTNCIAILDLKPKDPLYGNITNPPVPAAITSGGFGNRNSHAGVILSATLFGILLSLF